MGKAEYGSPKFIAKQMKARGLQRVRWYCQVCEKQCRDENGFKCHTQAPSHVARVLERGGRADIERYSRQFEADFLHVLRLSHGTKPAGANRVYNEYIHNRAHVHMSATKWPSLSAFVCHLGASGQCEVTAVASDGPPEFVLTLIDQGAAERQAKAERQRAERAHASEAASQAVLQAQLRAVRAEEEPPAAEEGAASTPEPGNPTGPAGRDTPAPNGKPAGKISFSLTRKKAGR